LEQLLALKALGDDGELTEHGQRMASLPLDPMLAHLLLESSKFSCTKEVLTAVAMISAENVYFHPFQEEAKQQAGRMHKQLAVHDGDLPTLVHIYELWLQSKRSIEWCRTNFINYRALAHAHEVRGQLERLLASLGYNVAASCGAEKDKFLRAVCAGLFMNVVRRRPASDGKRGHYSLVLGTRGVSTTAEVHIHPSSTLHGRNPPPAYLVFTELVETSRKYMRTLTVVQSSWLPEVAPHVFTSSS
jgi:HrpA-like RNA helicase